MALTTDQKAALTAAFINLAASRPGGISGPRAAGAVRSFDEMRCNIVRLGIDASAFSEADAAAWCLSGATPAFTDSDVTAAFADAVVPSFPTSPADFFRDRVGAGARPAASYVGTPVTGTVNTGPLPNPNFYGPSSLRTGDEEWIH